MKRLWLVSLAAAVLACAYWPLATAGDKEGEEKKKDDGWVQIFNGKDIEGWKTFDPERLKDWYVKDGILYSSGKKSSHLFSPRDDYENFHYRIEAKISDKGNSGQYFRATFAKAFPPGYEAQINSTHGDKVRTGSLYPDGRDGYTAEEKKMTLVFDKLVEPDTWFTQEVIAEGNHIVIKVNGKTTVDFTDTKNRHTKGHFAIQQHDPGGVIMIRKAEVMELPPTKR